VAEAAAAHHPDDRAEMSHAAPMLQPMWLNSGNPVSPRPGTAPPAAKSHLPSRARKPTELVVPVKV